MSKPVKITSAAHFSEILSSTKVVVADFYADWCGPCKAIAPLFEQLAAELSQPKIAAFVKIDTEASKDIASSYSITSLPTFIVFRDGKTVEKVQGADPRRLKAVVEKIATEVKNASTAGGSSSAGSSSGGLWLGAELPRGYGDVTDQIDLRNLDLLNGDCDSTFLRVLFEKSKPNALAKKDEKDWVESDTDEQLMLFTPFQSALKLHTIQFTSLPPKDSDDDEVPMRPKTIKLFTNKTNNLGFDDAENEQPIQTLELSENDWNADGTANIGLRFVRFQNITSLVIFVVDGDGDGEKVRLDRVRLIGQSGEKREMGKLEKIGDEPGE